MKNTTETCIYIFHADTHSKRLYVPEQVVKKARDLSSVEAKLYFERLRRYPGFEIIAW